MPRSAPNTYRLLDQDADHAADPAGSEPRERAGVLPGRAHPHHMVLFRARPCVFVSVVAFPDGGTLSLAARRCHIPVLLSAAQAETPPAVRPVSGGAEQAGKGLSRHWLRGAPGFGGEHVEEHELESNSQLPGAASDASSAEGVLSGTRRRCRADADRSGGDLRTETIEQSH